MGSILNKLLRAIPEIKSAAIVSAEGLPIACAFPKKSMRQEIDETRVAAMTAALLSLSEKAIIEMGKGDFDQLYIKGSEGYLLVMQAGPNVILIVSTTKDVRLGLILLDCRRACEKIAQIDGDFDDDEDRYPYPYIFKPPEPPGDIKVATQLQVNKFIEHDLENENVCPYCGMTLTRDELFIHNCRESPK
ncbi:MAG: roadblock/LC7 domain-containing protein [Promethearchaeota archaeon]